MECHNGTLHILKMDDEEFALVKESLQFFHECTIKSQEYRNDDDPTIQTAIKLEKMCQILRIDGFDFT